MRHNLMSWVWKWFEPDGGPRYGSMNHAQWEESMRADLQDMWDHTGAYAPVSDVGEESTP